MIEPKTKQIYGDWVPDAETLNKLPVGSSVLVVYVGPLSAMPDSKSEHPEVILRTANGVWIDADQDEWSSPDLASKRAALFVLKWGTGGVVSVKSTSAPCDSVSPDTGLLCECTKGHTARLHHRGTVAWVDMEGTG